MLSIGQSGINVNNLNLINVGDALTDTDALNR